VSKGARIVRAMRTSFNLLAHGSSESLSHPPRRDWLLHCCSQTLLNVILIWLATSTYRMGPFCQTQALKKDVKEKYVNRRVRQYGSRRLVYPQVLYCGRYYFLRICSGGQCLCPVLTRLIRSANWPEYEKCCLPLVDRIFTQSNFVLCSAACEEL